MNADTLKAMLATIAEKPIKVINADKWSLDAPGNAGWKWIGFRKDKPVACVIDDASRGYFKDEMLDAYADLFVLAPQLAAEVIRLREALAFYADRSGWNQPPVKTREGLISIEYENQASTIQRDRGERARTALNETPEPAAVLPG